MKTKGIIIALLAVSALAQTGNINSGNWTIIPPNSVYASRPGSPVNGQTWIMRDKLCDGSGSGPSNCRWNGTIWETIGGGGGTGTPGGSSGQVQVNSGGVFTGQASMFSGGTLKQQAVECASGNINAATLQAMGNTVSGEAPIQTSIAGSARWEHIQVCESTAFAGINTGSSNALTVSMGRPGSSNDEMTGGVLPLQVSSGCTSFLNTRPIPPALTGTYDVVLNFATAAYYNTGTVSVTNGSASITGSGTTWTTSMTGMWIALNGVLYQFTRVSNTTGTIAPVYAGTTASGIGNAYIQNLPNQVSAGVLTWEVCGYK